MGKETISLCAGVHSPYCVWRAFYTRGIYTPDPQCSIWVPYHIGCFALPWGWGCAEVFLLGFVLFFKLGSRLEKFNG